MNTNAFAAASSDEQLVIENEPRIEFDVYADVQRRTGVFVRLQFWSMKQQCLFTVEEVRS